MADATLYCKTCDERTGHMHLASRTCICSVCGEKTDAPNWREIEAAVEQRKKASQAAIAGRNRIETNTAPADTPAPDTETLTTKGETKMPRMTQDQKEEVVRRYKGGEQPLAIAEAMQVNRCTVYYTLSKAGVSPDRKGKKKAGRPAKAPKAAKASRTSKAALKRPEQAAAAPCSGFDEAGLTTLVKDAVHIQVSSFLSDLDRRISVKVRDALREAFK